MVVTLEQTKVIVRVSGVRSKPMGQYVGRMLEKLIENDKRVTRTGIYETQKRERRIENSFASIPPPGGFRNGGSAIRLGGYALLFLNFRCDFVAEGDILLPHARLFVINILITFIGRPKLFYIQSSQNKYSICLFRITI